MLQCLLWKVIEGLNRNHGATLKRLKQVEMVVEEAKVEWLAPPSWRVHAVASIAVTLGGEAGYYQAPGSESDQLHNVRFVL